ERDGAAQLVAVHHGAQQDVGARRRRLEAPEPFDAAVALAVPLDVGRRQFNGIAVVIHRLSPAASLPRALARPGGSARSTVPHAVRDRGDTPAVPVGTCGRRNFATILVSLTIQDVDDKEGERIQCIWYLFLRYIRRGIV